MKIILIYFAIKYNGDWDKIYKALESKEKVKLEDVKALEEKIKKEGMKVITILDADYPNAFKTAYKPPFVLWYKGDRKAIDKTAMAIVAGVIDANTLKLIDKNSPEANKTHSLVTTVSQNKEELAKHFDSKIVVADCGIDKVGTLIGDKDLIISEYPYGVEATDSTTKETNRLLAAIGQSIVIFSTGKEKTSITNITSSFVNLGKNVYYLKGCKLSKKMIDQGALEISSIRSLD